MAQTRTTKTPITMTTAFFLQMLALLAVATGEESVLTEKVLQISNVAAELSALAYGNASNISGADFEEIKFYTQEPDQAIVAKRDGRCYVAFRGTKKTVSDWLQNLNLGKVDIYKDNNNATGDSCVARAGFADFLFTPVVAEAYQDLKTCTESCSDPSSDCVVITGHSQGGASSAIASILLYSFMPTVVTFGMPPAFEQNCTLLPSDRFFRFVNHVEDNADNELVFDLVPFSDFFSGAVHFGHYILVGPDKTAAKYLGFDQNYTFIPESLGLAAHTMYGSNYSYVDRVANLLNTSSFPVSTNGFSGGTICAAEYSELCASGSCQNLTCTPAPTTSPTSAPTTSLTSTKTSTGEHTSCIKSLSLAASLGALFSWM